LRIRNTVVRRSQEGRPHGRVGRRSWPRARCRGSRSLGKPDLHRRLPARDRQDDAAGETVDLDGPAAANSVLEPLDALGKIPVLPEPHRFPIRAEEFCHPANAGIVCNDQHEPRTETSGAALPSERSQLPAPFAREGDSNSSWTWQAGDAEFTPAVRSWPLQKFNFAKGRSGEILRDRGSRVWVTLG
jgi:hypothetical protein